MDAVDPAERSMWLWDDAASPGEAAAFADAAGVSDVFLTVPWGGPTPATRALSRALRAGGIRVACLGSGADWADHPRNAARWADRALADGDFDGVHLDVEPWAAADWPAHAERRLSGLALAIEAVRMLTALPVEIDVPAALVAELSAPFARVLEAASAVTIMAYRDRALGVLDVSRAARDLAASVDRRFRIGVDTAPSTDPRATFADDGRRALARETAAVADALRVDPRFAGIAVHDFTWWRRLGP